MGEVKLALRRHVHGRNCRWWSGRRERFVGSNCRKTFFFAVGDDPDWSYLLPRRLPPGHYVLDVMAFDRARNRDQQFERGAGRAVFEVLDRSGRLVGPPRLRGSARAGRHALAWGARHASAWGARRASADGARHDSAAGRGASVEVMVVGRTRLIAAPRTVRAHSRRVRASGRRCLIGPSNPLAALAAALRLARVSYHLRDFGRCSPRSARSSGQLFVDRVGNDRNRDRDGWFYKVNHRAGTTGAADPSGIRGGRLRTGDRVLWFYCVFEPAARSCQRSLELVPSRRVTGVGERLRVRVLGYRNEGGGAPVAGATVTAGPSSQTTDAAGFADVSLGSAGRHELRAVKEGALPSFPVTVTVR